MRLAGIAVALTSGALLAVMTELNGELARHGGVVFASWVAHGLGTVAAGAALWVLKRGSGKSTSVPVPLWAYAGGLAGAATVIMTSAAVNSPLALAGTLALGLVGQAAFSLAADRWGLFGLPRRKSGFSDLAGIGLIVAGSVTLLVASNAAP